MKTSKATIEITLTLRGEPTAVVHALANGLPLEALDGIRGGMVAEMEKRGLEPPIFRSANLPGGDEFNAKLIERYRNRVKDL